METLTFIEWLVKFQEDQAKGKHHKHLRLGQYFVNVYVKNPWPELYYCESVARSQTMIIDYLMQLHYWPYMPAPLREELQ